MPIDHRAKLAAIKRFDQLIAYLRDEMGWPIARDSFEEVDDLFYEFTADELGIDPKTAAKIQEIKRLRPISARQPWGIFFIKFEPKRLPVVALRRILSQVALKKRASANSAERAAWASDDLLFISNYGEGDGRQISFAHFSGPQDGHDLPTLKVLGWDNRDTALHLDAVARELTEHLAWPTDDTKVADWRMRWRSAFNLRYRESINTSKELSVRLAELARAIRDRIGTALAIETENGPLTQLMKAFQTTLVHDLDADGFADMYAQTIAYGLLSARIADPHRKTVDDFSAHMRTNPFLRELMETFLKVGGRRGKAGGPGIDFDELGVSEVVDLLDAANIEAVVRDFGDRNRDEDPVMHFYELFLHEYDKKLKVQRGVFYTPQPVVSYIVRSVHEVLQTEFGLADGLADITTWGEMIEKHPGMMLPPLTDEPTETRFISPNEAFVQILDPATGTATFLVEVIDIIFRTLCGNWQRQGMTHAEQRAAWNDYVPKHLLPRLHGYELMMAPYAIAHMKVSLKLAETGYLFGSDERAQIYLTNALEPWVRQLPLIDFSALAHEAAAVNERKRTTRFTVIIGNPPYAGHSSNNEVEWIVSRVHDYTKAFPDLRKPGQGKWLQDDYVKFFRLAVHLLTSVGSGTVGLITNNGFLDNATFRGMRKHTSEALPLLSFIDLGGSVMKRERAEDGTQDENVFDIQQSVAITIGARSIKPNRQAKYLELVGTRDKKYRWLASHILSDSATYPISPTPPFYLFVPSDAAIGAEYHQWPGIHRLLGMNGDPAPGIVTTHDEFAISWTRAEQIEKVKRLLATKSETEARQLFRLCTQSQWSYSRAKTELPKVEWKKKLIQVLYRPFDIRWTVFDSNVAVHRRERVMRHMVEGKNLALIFMRQVALDDGYSHFGVSRFVVDNRAFYSNKGIMFLAPLYLEQDSRRDLVDVGRRSNLDPRLAAKIAERVGLKYLENANNEVRAEVGPEGIFGYAYAVFHSPSYRRRYEEFLKIDFPRLPLVGNLELFRVLSRLGGELIALHLLESPKLDQPTAAYFGDSRVLEVEKVSWSNDIVWLNKARASGFKGVREAVWNFHIGGYQVCEKWLKDRKGRMLSQHDIAHYQKMVGAIAETIRIMKEIDEVIEQHGGWPGAFQADETPATAAQADNVVRLHEPLVPEESRTFPTKERPRLRAAEPPAEVPREERVDEPSSPPWQDLEKADFMALLRQCFGRGGPRDRETAIRELCAAAGYERVGSRIREIADDAIRTAVRRGILDNDGSTLALATRSIEDYSRGQLKEQFLASLEGSRWTHRDEAIRNFARWLGFRRTGPAIDDIARSLINGLLREDRLEADGPDIRRRS